MQTQRKEGKTEKCVGKFGFFAVIKDLYLFYIETNYSI